MYVCACLNMYICVPNVFMMPSEARVTGSPGIGVTGVMPSLIEVLGIKPGSLAKNSKYS